MPQPMSMFMQNNRQSGRRMPPRRAAEPARNHPAAVPPPAPAPPIPEPLPIPEPPRPEPPPEPAKNAASGINLAELSALATDLPARIARLDGETLLLLGILWMLWQEKADRRLLIALAYILL